MRIKLRTNSILLCMVLLLFSGCQGSLGDGYAGSSIIPESSLVEMEPEIVPLENQPAADEPKEEPVLPVAFEPEEKLIAFTFDDGPGDYTAGLLDELAKRDAKATFFIATCRVTKANSDLVKRMDDEGHTVANHTVNHLKLHLLPTTQVLEEIENADETLRKITGKTPELLRPPYGNFTARVLSAVGKPTIVWSIDTKDWRDHDAEIIRDVILQNASDGDIILLHEWEESSKHGALLAMDALAEKGYQFVTVPELFARKDITLETEQYYAAANGKDFEERLVFDKHDKFPNG